MPTVSVEKVENGYILSYGSKRYVQPGFAEVVVVLAGAFGESEFIPRSFKSKTVKSATSAIEVRKPGRPRKAVIKQKGNNG